MSGPENDDDTKLDEINWRKKALADIFAYEPPSASEEDAKAGEEYFEQFCKLQELEKELDDLQLSVPLSTAETVLKADRGAVLRRQIADKKAQLYGMPADSAKFASGELFSQKTLESVASAIQLDERPLQKGEMQRAAIVAIIRELGYEPLALPKIVIGKPGIKAKVWAKIKKNVRLFTSRKTFENSWQCARDCEDIAEE